MSNESVQLEKDTGSKVVITIREHGMPMVEEYSNGVKMGSGVYSHETIARTLIQSMDHTEIRTPILPKNALMYFEGPLRRVCIIEVPAHKRKALYHEAVIKGVPYPRLVMAFVLTLHEGKFRIMSVHVAALKSDEITSEQSRVYFYPYTNVHNDSDFSVCWGSNRLPVIERISQLSTFPDLFLDSPNSDSYYHSANLSKMTYRELVTSLQKAKDFPDEYLKPSAFTLNDWVTKLTDILV